MKQSWLSKLLIFFLFFAILGISSSVYALDCSNDRNTTFFVDCVQGKCSGFEVYNDTTGNYCETVLNIRDVSNSSFQQALHFLRSSGVNINVPEDGVFKIYGLEMEQNPIVEKLDSTLEDLRKIEQAKVDSAQNSARLGFYIRTGSYALVGLLVVIAIFLKIYLIFVKHKRSYTSAVVSFVGGFVLLVLSWALISPWNDITWDSVLSVLPYMVFVLGILELFTVIVSKKRRVEN